MDELLNKAPCGYVSFTDDGKIVQANATLQKIVEEENSLKDRPFESLLSPGSRIFYQTHFFPILKLNGVIEELYLSLRTTTGLNVPVLASAVKRDWTGPTMYDAVFLKMHQRKRFEDEMITAKRAAEETSEAKSRSLSIMSHELRTPLSAISGFADVISMGLHGPVTDAQRDDLRRIKNAGQYLLTLINGILSFAGLETGKISIHSVPVVVVDALSAAEALVVFRIQEAGLTFSREQCAPDLKVFADPDRLQQILLNLLTNAFKFTGPGGHVSIACERSNTDILIHVSDTGPGVPPSQIERIFDPFVQLDQQRIKTSQRGIGLGLAISRDLARAMSGDLTVRSTLGQGSTFTIRLRAAD